MRRFSLQNLVVLTALGAICFAMLGVVSASADPQHRSYVRVGDSGGQSRQIRLGPDRALVYFGYRMRTRTGSRVTVSHGKESMVVERGPAGWRVRFIHWHRDA